MDKINNMKIMLCSIVFAILAHGYIWIVLDSSLDNVLGISIIYFYLGFIVLSDVLLIIMYLFISRNIKKKKYIPKKYQYLIIFLIAFLIEINIVTFIYMAGIILISGIFILGVGKVFTVPMIYIISHNLISHYTVKFKNVTSSSEIIEHKSNDIFTVLLYVLMFIVTIYLAILYFPNQI